MPDLPVPFNAADGNQLKTALKTYPSEAIKKALDIYMDRTDNFTAGRGFTMRHFISELPGIFASGGKSNLSEKDKFLRNMEAKNGCKKTG